MHLTVTARPVTIISLRNTQQWVTMLFRHTDGTLFLYHNNGLDCSFSPMHRYRSINGGRTWIDEEDNLPRLAWAHSFGDGELYEVDTYGILDPNEAGTYCYYGAWSFPNHPDAPIRRDTVRVYAPSCAALTAVVMQTGYYPIVPYSYPLNPWKPLIYEVLGKWVKAPYDDVLIGGPCFTAMVEDDERLIALGYWTHREDAEIAKTDMCAVPLSVFCYESHDRGRTWREVSTVARGARDTAEGFNEATLVRLKDRRLYAVYRAGRRLYHGWSTDGGRSWTQPEPLSCAAYDAKPGHAWPVCQALQDGTLVLGYGRPGMHLLIDPSGTGRHWQGHLDLTAVEVETQAFMGVPPQMQMREDINMGQLFPEPLSSEYLSLATVGARELLVTYDVHYYYEHWNSLPVDGVRMLKVRVDD